MFVFISILSGHFSHSTIQPNFKHNSEWIAQTESTDSNTQFRKAQQTKHFTLTVYQRLTLISTVLRAIVDEFVSYDYIVFTHSCVARVDMWLCACVWIGLDEFVSIASVKDGLNNERVTGVYVVYRCVNIRMQENEARERELHQAIDNVEQQKWSLTTSAQINSKINRLWNLSKIDYHCGALVLKMMMMMIIFIYTDVSIWWAYRGESCNLTVFQQCSFRSSQFTLSTYIRNI